MRSLKISTEKNVCFWGAAASVPKTTVLMSDCLRSAGENTGNLFIGSGLYAATNAPCKEYWDFYGQEPKEFDEKFSTLFVPASNFIFRYTDLSDQASFFERTKAEIFMFGLGSQIKPGEDIDLLPGTLRFLKLVSERSKSIGVRGVFTAEVMGKLGIKNVEIVGCPSMLTIPSDFTLNAHSVNSIRLSGNFTNNAREHAFSDSVLKNLESHLFKELVARSGYYVLQNEQHEIELRTSLLTISSDLSQQEFHLNRLGSLFSNVVSKPALKAFLRWQTKLFFSTDDWISFMRTIDLSFGTRFHGNVAAILAGKPAYLICHDQRTLELAELYRLPHRKLGEGMPLISIDEIIEECDMTAFVENYKILQRVWKSFIQQNGFDCSVE